jgi:transaldolase
MNYFERLARQTETRMWVNNPNMDEMDLALSIGVKNVTTNPAYCAKLMKCEPEYIRKIIDGIVINEKNDDRAADLIYQTASRRIMEKFSVIHCESSGKDGYVTIQPDPRQDDHSAQMTETIERHRGTGANYLAKIPVTSEGVKVIESALREGIPVCATEIFSISQALYVCELHKRVTDDTHKEVPMYVTHITGIFDEYLSRLAKLEKIQICPDILSQAGCAVGHKEYRLIRERGYKVRMLGGGARGIHHFTGFVGGNMDITVNWSTARELIEMNEVVIDRIDTVTSEDVIEELRSKFADFGVAYDEEGLGIEAFASYGPVRLFRNYFVEGYYQLLSEIAARRAQLLL